MSTNVERGVAPQRVDFAREDYLGAGTFGVTPTDPTFLKYSDRIANLSVTPSAMLQRRGGIGSADPVDFQRGPEENELAITYDLVKPISATGDAVYDGAERQGDEMLPDSHSIVMREDKTRISAGATVSGNVARPTRLYLYGRGGLISDGSIIGDASEQVPISVELSYALQYLRGFQIDQPTSGEGSVELLINSTDSSDTGLTVKVEDESGTGESVTLDSTDATTHVLTSNAYSDIDAVYVPGDNVGDIQVFVNSGTTTSPTVGDQLSTVYGETTYDGVESDYGIPPIEAGSRESVSALGSPENFLGSAIEADASPYPYQIQSVTVTFENNLEATELASGFGMHRAAGNRDVTWEATVFGERTSIDSLRQHFQNNTRTHTWSLTNSTLTLPDSHLTEPGEVAKEEGQAVMTIDNTWTAEGLTIS